MNIEFDQNEGDELATLLDIALRAHGYKALPFVRTWDDKLSEAKADDEPASDAAGEEGE